MVLSLVLSIEMVLLGNDVAEVLNAFCCKVTFLEFAIPLGIGESFEDLVNMLCVLFECLRIDKNVVQVHDNELVKPVIEESVHSSLESGRGISESKWHDNEFVCAITGSEGGFVFVADFDGNLVITSEEIEFCEEFGVCEAVMKVVDSWKREVVFLRDFVQTAIVNTHANGSILFLDKEDGGTKRACGGAYVSMGEVFFDLSLCFVEFVWCLTVESSWRDFVVGNEVDGMMDAVGRGFVGR